MELTPKQVARLGQWFDQAMDLPTPERHVLIEAVRRDEGDGMADELASLLTASLKPTDTIDWPQPQLPHREGARLSGR